MLVLGADSSMHHFTLIMVRTLFVWFYNGQATRGARYLVLPMITKNLVSNGCIRNKTNLQLFMYLMKQWKCSFSKNLLTAVSTRNSSKNKIMLEPALCLYKLDIFALIII